MKICFWGNVAGSLNGAAEGGGELQIALLAKALAKAGHEVVIIDYNTNKDYESIYGIKVISINGWNKGIRFFRTFTHRFPQLYKTLINQHADIYYCRIRDFRHIFSYLAARRVNGKFILGLASDLDVMSLKKRAKYYYFSNVGNFLWWFFNGILTELIYPFLIRNSDYIFAQHEGQMNILRKKEINSVLFPNLIEINELPVLENPVRNDFIYVGSLDKRKGFVDFYKLICKTPDISFKIVGKPRDKTGYIFFEKLKSFKNVTLLGRLKHTETLIQIANSKALISTSPMEGFPNIFIEAWAYGIPVLSLFVDPGSIILKENLGLVMDGKISRLIDTLLENKFDLEIGKRSLSYVERTHDINDKKVKEISALFDKL